MKRVMGNYTEETESRDKRSELFMTNQVSEPGGISPKMVQWELLENVYE